MNEQLDCRLSLEVLSSTTKPLAINVPQENRLRSRSVRFETLSEDIGAIQTGDTTAFMRKVFPRQCVTIPWTLDFVRVLEHAANTLSPRDDEHGVPTGWIRGHTKIGPVLEVKVTCHSDQKRN